MDESLNVREIVFIGCKTPILAGLIVEVPMTNEWLQRGIDLMKLFLNDTLKQQMAILKDNIQ